MLSTRRTRSPASDSLSGATIGIAPPTAASNLRSTPAASAASNSSPPWAASSSLFAVTTGLPSRMARRMSERAGSIPPITSTTTSTSGSVTTSAASPLMRVGSTAGSRLRVTSRTATRCNAIDTPARSRTGVACSTSSRATPVPTTPQPSIPTLSASPTSPPVRPSRCRRHLARPAARRPSRSTSGGAGATLTGGLHPLWGAHADHRQGVGEHLPGGLAEPPAGTRQALVIAQDPAVSVEAVEGGRQVLRVAGEAVRGPLPAGHHHQLLVGGELAQQCRLHRVLEQPEVGLLQRRRHEPHLGGLTDDAGDAGVGVLDVVHRVVHRLAGDRLDVELDRGVDRVPQHGVAEGVLADLVEQLVDGDDVA